MDILARVAAAAQTHAPVTTARLLGTLTSSSSKKPLGPTRGLEAANLAAQVPATNDPKGRTNGIAAANRAAGIPGA